MPLLPATTKHYHSSVSSSYLNNITFESLIVNPTTRNSFSSLPHDDIIEKLNEFNRHPGVKILSSHQYAFGLNILIKIGIYLTAYSPHEQYRSNTNLNRRELLYFYWAQIKHVSKCNFEHFLIQFTDI